MRHRKFAGGNRSMYLTEVLIHFLRRPQEVRTVMIFFLYRIIKSKILQIDCTIGKIKIMCQRWIDWDASAKRNKIGIISTGSIEISITRDEKTNQPNRYHNCQ